ncbi:MAG: GLUG motif-containing protein [Balneolales bacterium]
MMRYLMLLFGFFFIATSSQAQFAGGSGTEADPYEVSTLEELQEMENHLDSHFILTAEIDAADTETWNEGAGFSPIGVDTTTSFTGSFDGNGYVITNLTINREEQDFVGLFGASTGTINNAALEDAVITGNEQTGALAGENRGVISGSYTTGEVSGLEMVGGLVGYNPNAGEIAGSYSSANVTATQTAAGGLAGKSDGSITESYAAGNVASGEVSTEGFGAIGTGGLVGVNSSGVISSSYATGEVTVTNDFRAGGLVGYNTSAGEIVNCYATGNVTGDDRVGGLVGGNRNDATITTSYATGVVTGGNRDGGVVGVNDQFIIDSYWDTESTGLTNGAGNDQPSGAIGLTTDQMTGINPFEAMSGFDFDGIWLLTNNYPALHWEEVEALEPPVFAGGSGTEEDPFQLSTLDQLQEMENHLDSHFIQTADIDAADTETWNDGAGFSPIGVDTTASFTGSFDGNGHVIMNLTIHREEQDFVGLFGASTGAIINAALVDVVIAGNEQTGALIGENRGVISGSYTTGEVSGLEMVGGLVGYNPNTGEIANSSSSANVTATQTVAGGLAGKNDGTITESYAGGSVASGEIATEGLGTIGTGGLVGVNSSGVVSSSYATGEVTVPGTDIRAGGLVGYNTSAGEIVNCYATGNVTGADRVGGLVGGNRNTGSITTSYATGVVTGGNRDGGLVGVNTEFIIDSYWDTESTGLTNGAGNDQPSGAIGLTTAEMTGPSAAAHMAGFDFDEFWVLIEDYPALHWEDVDAFIRPDMAVLSLPEDESENITIPVTFEWVAADDAVNYNLQIATDEEFSNVIVDESGIETTTLTVEDEALFEPMTNYYWRVQSIGEDLDADWSAFWTFQTSVNVSNENLADVPAEFALEQNYPNPFNPTTNIEYALPENATVQLHIFDVLGRRITTLVNEMQQPGTYQVNWDASQLSSGMYIYRLQAGDFVQTRQMMLVK